MGKSDIPLYSNILELLEQFRFDLSDAERYIKNNKHNHITTTYYLLMKRYERLGKPLELKEESSPEPLNRSAQAQQIIGLQSERLATAQNTRDHNNS